MFSNAAIARLWRRRSISGVQTRNDIYLDGIIYVDDLIKKSGLSSRYVKYLLGAGLLASAAGFALPTGPVPYFNPWSYSRGGHHQSAESGTSISCPILIVYRLVGWLTLAGWADIVGRRNLVTKGLHISTLLALGIAFLPPDISLAVAVMAYQFVAAAWVGNAELMQSEAVQPLKVIVPISLIKLFGSLTSTFVWVGGWSIVSYLTVPDDDDDDLATSDLNERMKFLLCGLLLLMGNILIQVFAFESPHYLVLKKRQDAAWDSLKKLCEDCDFSESQRQNVVLALQDTDASTHYIHYRKWSDKVIAHAVELWAFFSLEGELMAYNQFLTTPRATNSSRILSSSVAREETPVSRWNNDSEPHNDLTAVSATGRIPDIFSFANKLNIAEDSVVTEVFEDDYDNYPFRNFHHHTNAPTALSLLILVALAMALALSVETWAGRFWSATLSDPGRDLRRLYVDGAGVVGAVLTIAFSNFFAQKPYHQFRALLLAIVSLLSVMLLLHTFWALDGYVRLVFCLLLPCAMGMADSAAMAMLIDHVPLSLRASVLACAQALALVIYLTAHSMERLAPSVIDGSDHDVWVLPVIWLASCLGVGALFTNLLWPHHWKPQ